MSKNKFIIRSRLIAIRDGKLLVVKHSPEATFYALPGGHLESGENPLVCINREIKEELGIDLNNPELKYIYEWQSDDGSDQVEFYFVVHDTGEFKNFDTKNRTHAFEIVDMKWIDKDSDIRVLPEFIMDEFRDCEFEFEGIRFI